MKSSLIVLLIALVAGVCSFFAWKVLFESQSLNQTSKLAFAQMHGSLKFGDTEQRVEDVYRQFSTERTTLRKRSFQETWEAIMPPEFGAGDWVLFIQFDSDRKVSAVVMRTSDGISVRMIPLKIKATSPHQCFPKSQMADSLAPGFPS